MEMCIIVFLRNMFFFVLVFCFLFFYKMKQQVKPVLEKNIDHRNVPGRFPGTGTGHRPYNSHDCYPACPTAGVPHTILVRVLQFRNQAKLNVLTLYIVAAD